MMFNATVTDRTPWTVIRLEGELDLLTATAASRAIEREIGAGASRIVLDLADLSFIDTSGASGVLQMRDEAERTGVDLVVANPGETAKLVLEVTGIRDVIETPAELVC